MGEKRFVKRIIAVGLATLMAVPISTLSTWSKQEAFATGEEADYTDESGIEYTITDSEKKEVEVSGHNVDITGEVVIPSTISIGEINYNVTSIGDNAFYECTAMKGIKLPEGIKSIGKYAFYLCCSFSSVILPSTVETIGEGAFNRSTLSEIKLPDGLKTIELMAFSDTHLKNIDLPSGLTELGSLAFSSCDLLESIKIPNNITEIPSGICLECESLTRAQIPDNTTVINDGAFESCRKLEDINIPDTITKLGGFAFYCCVKLKSIELPDAIERIEECTFDNCDGLEYIKLPKNLTYIGRQAFQAASLTSIDIPDGVTEIGHDAFAHTDITSIVLPSKLQTLGEDAFYWSDYLTTVIIPESVTTIGNRAFGYCNNLTTCYTYSTSENIPSTNKLSLVKNYRLALDGGIITGFSDNVFKVKKADYTLTGWKDTSNNELSELPDNGGDYVATYMLKSLLPNLTITKDEDCHFTKTVSSGDEEQLGVYGKMEPIVYTADQGYYFPDNYNSDKSMDADGVKVVRDSLKQITVSGQVSENTVITLAAASEKVAQDAPSVTGGSKKILGTSSDMEYAACDYPTKWISCSDDFTSVEGGKDYYVRYKETDLYAPGLAIRVSVSFISVKIINPENSHMTLLDTSASEEQDNVDGNLHTIVYAADEGYYFPEEYNEDKSLDKNGIKVVRETESVISINGIPTDSTQITLLPASASEYNIILDSNGGTFGNCIRKAVPVKYGEKLGTLSVPVKKGYVFEGWYTEISGGTKITEDTVVDFRSERTYYAHWSGAKCTITLFANGGKIGSSATSKITVTNGNAIGTLAVPTRVGYTFDGWYTAKVDGTRILEAQVADFSGDTTIYARWIPNKYIITLYANGGKIGSGVTYKKYVTYDEQLGDLSIPKKVGYTFTGWYTAKSGGSKITSDTIAKMTSNITYYAHWTANKYTVTLFANGGKVGSSATQKKYVIYDTKLGTLATPTRTGYTFAGWYTAKTGGTKVTSETVAKMTSDVTYYAHWTANKYTVTLFANGGKIGTSVTSKLTVTFDSKMGTLATPKKAGYTFVGWYTAKTGGTKITSTTVVKITSNVTYYAHWSKN